MKMLELYMIGRELELTGWVWETWSGSFYTDDAKGWWFLPDAKDVRAMRRGDPKPYVLATITTYELYVKEKSNAPAN